MGGRSVLRLRRRITRSTQRLSLPLFGASANYPTHKRKSQLTITNLKDKCKVFPNQVRQDVVDKVISEFLLSRLDASDDCIRRRYAFAQKCVDLAIRSVDRGDNLTDFYFR